LASAEVGWPQEHRDGIGAEVTVVTGFPDRNMQRFDRQHYLSASDSGVHLGWGKKTLRKKNRDSLAQWISRRSRGR